ncbi:hypothetical protein [Litorihabitans aurantiacus]|uniref:Uncharacterized protein n=1 Tax=Litorihabitans aurantiacus TaxID=1930061 RepID=A0AA37XGR0_9MICO|nr:hypothetical protein [Litorihabitans aurantiacus]GMA32879.1 hypothetical protein GCM10025875_28710 [Litorihabitans aurantiacus]
MTTTPAALAADTVADATGTTPPDHTAAVEVLASQQSVSSPVALSATAPPPGTTTATIAVGAVPVLDETISVEEPRPEPDVDMEIDLTDVMAKRAVDADAARFAHPSAWRSRADAAVRREEEVLRATTIIRSASIVVEGPPTALVLRVECEMASEAVPLEVMRHLNDELPLRLADAVGHPLPERHLELTIAHHTATDAA